MEEQHNRENFAASIVESSVPIAGSRRSQRLGVIRLVGQGLKRETAYSVGKEAHTNVCSKTEPSPSVQESFVSNGPKTHFERNEPPPFADRGSFCLTQRPTSAESPTEVCSRSFLSLAYSSPRHPEPGLRPVDRTTEKSVTRGRRPLLRVQIAVALRRSNWRCFRCFLMGSYWRRPTS